MYILLSMSSVLVYIYIYIYVYTYSWLVRMRTAWLKIHENSGTIGAHSNPPSVSFGMVVIRDFHHSGLWPIVGPFVVVGQSWFPMGEKTRRYKCSIEQ